MDGFSQHFRLGIEVGNDIIQDVKSTENAFGKCMYFDLDYMRVSQ
jgi:hypothetical protein